MYSITFMKTYKSQICTFALAANLSKSFEIQQNLSRADSDLLGKQI